MGSQQDLRDRLRITQDTECPFTAADIADVVKRYFTRRYSVEFLAEQQAVRLPPRVAQKVQAQVITGIVIRVNFLFRQLTGEPVQSNQQPRVGSGTG